MPGVNTTMNQIPITIAVLPYGNEALGMASLFLLGSCFMIWYLRKAIKTGKITSSSGSSSSASARIRTYHRDEKPKSFWLTVSIYSLWTLCLFFFTVLFAIRFGVVDIHDAVSTYNVGAINKYLATGGDVNAKDERGHTPLHYSARLGYSKIIALLIAKGADVNTKVLNGGTPLHLAVGEHRMGAVELLITNDADVNAKIEGGDHKGKTPLDLVIHFKQSRIADLLRKHGGKTSEELKSETDTPSKDDEKHNTTAKPLLEPPRNLNGD